MTKRKFRVQWVAILCLIALLVGALSVFLFRNPVTAADLSGKGIREDFSGFTEGDLYRRTAEDYKGCVDESNWSEHQLTKEFSSPDDAGKLWRMMLYNGNIAPKRCGFNVPKYLAIENVTGNIGGNALKLSSSYSAKSWVGTKPSDMNNNSLVDNSTRFEMTVNKDVTVGATTYLRFRFMVPNEYSNINLYIKAGNGWPAHFVTIRGTEMRIAQNATVTATLQTGHWYDVLISAKYGEKQATMTIDGESYTVNCYVAFTSVEYPIFQAQPSVTEGYDSILYLDDLSLFEKTGDYSVLTDRMNVVSADYPLTESTLTVLRGTTAGEIRKSITMAYDVAMKITDGENELSDDAQVENGNTLVFTTADNLYTATVKISAIEDRPANKDASDTFNNVSFRIGKDSATDGNIYKGSATTLLDGVTASSVFGDGDSLSVARAPFKRAGDNGLIFRSDKTSTSARMTALRSSSLPYTAGYGHILEFDVIVTGEGGVLTVARTAASDTIAISPDGITFGGETAEILTDRYYRITWEITAGGVQNVYVDGVLLASKSGSASASGSGISFTMTKEKAVNAEFAVDNLLSYLQASVATPTADTSYPRSDVMNVTEASRTFYIQGANFDVKYLIGTFGQDDVALYDKDGNELTKGNFDRKTGYLVYYPKNNGTVKIYTLGNPSFSFSSIYADGMVLQRNRDITLGGFANASGIDATATLTDKDGVILAINQTKTVAGQFEITLPPMAAAKGLSLNIRIASGSEVFYDKTFTDVAIGEVWILSGQSNMAFEAKDMEDAAQYLANADNYGDNIRYYTQSRIGSFTPETDTKGGGWYVASAENLKAHAISGIGYVMATRLAEQFGDDVPVAIVNAYYAGSSIVAWFDLDTVQTKYENLYQTYLEKKAAGTPSSWNTIPSVCYNQLVHPIKGYTASGLLWYQGESDCGRPNLYGDYYKTLTSLWREWLHNDELPFVVMQLAPYPSKNYSAFRNLQYNMVQSDPYSYLISTMDDGPVFNAADNRDGYGYSHVHPAKKSGIGLRTADMILGAIYGIDLGRAYKAPEVISVKRDGEKVILTFDTELTLLYGDVVTGFTLNKVAAVGKIDGKTLTLTAAGVTEPTEVAYAQDTLTVVMKDGTVYRNVTNVHVGNDADSNKTYSDRSYTTFDAIGADGNKVTVKVGAGSHDVIRSTYGGNLTNESGYALPAFSLTVSAE